MITLHTYAHKPKAWQGGQFDFLFSNKFAIKSSEACNTFAIKSSEACNMVFAFPYQTMH